MNTFLNHALGQDVGVKSRLDAEAGGTPYLTYNECMEGKYSK